MGLELGTIEEVEIPVEIKELMKEREKAKEVKDYAASDVIREQINAAGYQIKDAPEGTTVVKK
ncbi:MAG: Cysteine-tRNA ligase [Candidatus Collierbacteria bacterium GW2011_GWF1_44_12]|uniref:Cysteine-tRNA ligase n=1 Tax=Candidatus Collierbacteria bacterium GW2011_GWF1_44_12 TaxID=1618402 RepID=A0A0G1GWK2_9BACT|nr:MAG: Cysteine-tRNA ligase [Candidatus Collierbacteria bacterium GW2011_GWF1_44_12]